MSLLSTVVCIFGTIANILNIIVLTRFAIKINYFSLESIIIMINYSLFFLSFHRKNMVSATNSILTGLAVADMLVMIDYVRTFFNVVSL